MNSMLTGSLQTKAGKFYMVLNIYKDGKRKQVWQSTGLIVKGNKTKAAKMLRDTINKMEREAREAEEAAHDPGNTPFMEQLHVWLQKKQSKVDEVTYQGYVSLIDAHIEPYFSPLGLKVNQVDEEVLQTYFDFKSASGRLNGKGGLSANSLRQHMNILHQVMGMCVKKGLIRKNPCDDIELPQSERYHANFYTATQINDFFAAIRDEPLYPLYKITFMYGLRRSEVLGLKWDSVDLDAGMFTIQHTVVSVIRKVEKDKTKNQTSRRSYPLSPDVKKILLDLKAQQEEDKRICGQDYIQTDYVFRWPDGHPYAPDYVTRKFSQLLKRHGLPHIRLHDLRHSSASSLLSRGYGLKDVQEWLGHSDIKMTANIYGHLEIQRKKALTDTMSDLLSGQKTG